MIARKMIHLPQDFIPTLQQLQHLLPIFFSKRTLAAINNLRTFLIFLSTFRAQNNHVSELVATLFLGAYIGDYLVT